MFNINELSIISNTDVISINRLIDYGVIKSEGNLFKIEDAYIIILTKLLTKYKYVFSTDEYKQIKNKTKLYDDLLNSYLIIDKARNENILYDNNIQYDAKESSRFKKIIYDGIEYKFEIDHVVYNKINFDNYEYIYLEKDELGEISSSGGKCITISYNGKLNNEEIALYYLLKHCIENNIDINANLEREICKKDEDNYKNSLSFYLNEKSDLKLKYIYSANLKHNTNITKLKKMMSLTTVEDVKTLFPTVLNVKKFDRKLEIVNTNIECESLLTSNIIIDKYKFDYKELSIDYILDENEIKYLVKIKFDVQDNYYTLQINEINAVEESKGGFLSKIFSKNTKEQLLPSYVNILDIIKNNID